ncbi:2Fe-2S iron-sulfur cluster binding domain-containing protein [Candidatus Poribacteria bacterium]|nr:2Fe-2S iron-sulfur cluster binding domain-containing protein [Candidatus Poribacteria bacterium]
MPKLTIDNREVEVEQGSTLLDAAQKLGIDIPTLCFRAGCQPSTSCLVCVVKVNNRLVPSCATLAEPGMQVESETSEIHQARRTTLELLLSDHVGDCMAPCQSICPAEMNIPLMIRQTAAGKLRDAIATVKEHIALPAVLGRICPAPCENGCRRGNYDCSVSICLLKRYVADVDLASEKPYLPSCKPQNGKRIALVGAGPTGLAAAYYLLREGYACVLFDEHEKPGGMLQYGVPEDKLPRDVLDAEIGLIEKLGAEFRMNTRVGEQPSLETLQNDFDAVLIAIGELKDGDADQFGLQASTGGIQVDRDTFKTNLKGVFAGGNATRRRNKMAVRSVADGKTAAISIDQYLSGIPITGPHKPFTVHIGRLAEGELQKFMVGVSESGRVTPSSGDSLSRHFSDEAAHAEALRCLHCDCRKADNCKLRDYADVYQANPNRYKGDRRLFEQYAQHPNVIYEPGKCIDCGLCIQIASKAGEPLGLTFIGRGFNVRVGVPFNRSIAEGLSKVANQCVAACPTGALAFK